MLEKLKDILIEVQAKFIDNLNDDIEQLEERLQDTANQVLELEEVVEEYGDLIDVLTDKILEATDLHKLALERIETLKAEVALWRNKYFIANS